MKITREVPTTYTAVDKIICDICNEEMNESDLAEYGERKSSCSEYHTNVSCEWGSYYPDGTWAERYDFDVCIKCFMEKVLPLFKKEGLDLEPEEVRG